MKPKRKLQTAKPGKGLLFLLVMIIYCCSSYSQTTYRSTKDKIKKIMLADSTEVWMDKNSELKLDKVFNKTNRKVYLKGDAYFMIKHDQVPFIIHTGHLVISTHEAFMRVDAYPGPGEETDVLKGIVNVKKSYHSTLDNDKYVIGPAQMVMINRDIDLMEKEKYDTTDLKKWLQRFR